jgi:hypothetical protein
MSSAPWEIACHDVDVMAQSDKVSTKIAYEPFLPSWIRREVRDELKDIHFQHEYDCLPLNSIAQAGLPILELPVVGLQWQTMRDLR